mmetsp:Transcript_37344/g.94177  ORF Transcript_37344/g.94177 Transcript_37344/m.94177 type:complete len:221 (-) Transcript_37344:1152-1814(-)
MQLRTPRCNQRACVLATRPLLRLHGPSLSHMAHPATAREQSILHTAHCILPWLVPLMPCAYQRQALAYGLARATRFCHPHLLPCPPTQLHHPHPAWCLHCREHRHPRGRCALRHCRRASRAPPAPAGWSAPPGSCAWAAARRSACWACSRRCWRRPLHGCWTAGPAQVGAAPSGWTSGRWNWSGWWAECPHACRAAARRTWGLARRCPGSCGCPVSAAGS